MKKILCLLLLALLTLVSCAPVQEAEPSPALHEQPVSGLLEIIDPPPDVAPAPSGTPAPVLTAQVDIPGYKAYMSGGKGEKISGPLTTGDLELFFSLNCEKLLYTLGGEYTDLGVDIDTGLHGYEYPLFAMRLWFEADNKEDDRTATLKSIQINEFSFRGITEKDDFNTIMKKLGKTRILKIPAEDSFSYALQYRFDRLLFEFYAGDEEANDGAGLMVYPVKEYKKYYPVDVKEIDGWFGMPKQKLIFEMGKDYTADEEESGITGVYNDYDYKEKGIKLHFEQDRLVRLELDGRYRVGGSKKAQGFADIQKALGKGVLEESEPTYALTYTYKNFVLEFTSCEEDGFNYKMQIHSILQY